MGVGPPNNPNITDWTIGNEPCGTNMCFSITYPAFFSGGTMAGYELCYQLPFPSMECPINITSINPYCLNAPWDEKNAQGDFYSSSFLNSCFNPHPGGLYMFEAIDNCTGRLQRRQLSMEQLDNMKDSKGNNIFTKEVQRPSQFVERIVYKGIMYIMLMLPVRKTIAESGYFTEAIPVHEQFTFEFYIALDSDLDQWIVQLILTTLDDQNRPKLTVQLIQNGNRFLSDCQPEPSSFAFTLQMYPSASQLGTYTMELLGQTPCVGYCEGIFRWKCKQEITQGATKIRVEDANFAMNGSFLAYDYNATTSYRVIVNECEGSIQNPYQNEVNIWDNANERLSAVILFDRTISANQQIVVNSLFMCDGYENHPCVAMVLNNKQVSSELASKLDFRFNNISEMQSFGKNQAIGFNIGTYNVDQYGGNYRIVGTINIESNPSTFKSDKVPNVAMFNVALPKRIATSWLQYWPYFLAGGAVIVAVLAALFVGCLLGRANCCGNRRQMGYQNV